MIKLKIHFLFWLLLAGGVITGQFTPLLTMFIIVFAHEMGHIVVANHFGWKIREIEILPFGGVARMDPSSKEDVWEEFWIALAGPMVNGMLILISLLLMGINIWSLEWTLFFMFGNAAIGLFNLVPIYPLDGGRILQVLLSNYFPFRKAILLSLAVGVFLCISILGLSLWKLELGLQVWMVIPYLFVMIVLEYRRLPYRFIAFLLTRHHKQKKGLLMQTAYIPVHEEMTLKKGTEKMYRHRYHLFRLKQKQKSSFHQNNEPVYFSEKHVLREVFDRSGPFTLFKELNKE